MFAVDIRRADPLGDRDAAAYGTVISAYCADSATGNRATWESYMTRIAGLVRPGGTLLTAALRRSCGYVVGGKTFPSPNVDAHDMRAVLRRCFGGRRFTVEACDLGESESKGYSSIVLAQARRGVLASSPLRPVTHATDSPVFHARSDARITNV